MIRFLDFLSSLTELNIVLNPTRIISLEKINNQVMSKSNNAYDFIAKLLIIGDSGVGKTCLLLRFCENNFTISHLATIGIFSKMSD